MSYPIGSRRNANPIRLSVAHELGRESRHGMAVDIDRPADLLDGSTAADTALKSIRAIRVAIIVRAPLNEKDATNLLQNSSGGNVPVFASLSAATQANTVSFNWDVPAGNFRYREIETTIPVRNGLF